jgi:DNA replication protein DnaC
LAEQLIEAQHDRLTSDDVEQYRITVPYFWQRIREASFVVLDELGCRDRVSDHVYEAVKRLLDEREGRPLMVLSNLDLEAIEKLYDDRLTSRLAAGTVVELIGPDMRVPQ